MSEVKSWSMSAGSSLVLLLDQRVLVSCQEEEEEPELEGMRAPGLSRLKGFVVWWDEVDILFCFVLQKNATCLLAWGGGGLRSWPGHVRLGFFFFFSLLLERGSVKVCRK